MKGGYDLYGNYYPNVQDAINAEMDQIEAIEEERNRRQQMERQAYEKAQEEAYREAMEEEYRRQEEEYYKQMKSNEKSNK